MTADPRDHDTTQPQELDTVPAPLGELPAGARRSPPARPALADASPASRPAAAASTQPTAPSPAAGNTDAAAQLLDLRSLRLRAGLALQVALAGAADPAQPDLQFLAAISGKGVMVGPAAEAAAAGAAPPALTLKPGQEVLVRGFTGQHDFSFATRVLQTFVDPFAYALLAYPAQVQARQVRQAPRLRTAVPAQVQSFGADPVPATVVDLSPHGALLHTAQPLGRPDDLITLTLHAVVGDRRLDVLLHARIRHTQSAGTGGQHTGVQFIGVQQQEWLVLQAMCGVGEAA
ncbi:MAG: PilZ domain-containing protein [Pseudomonadota bacterium]